MTYIYSNNNTGDVKKVDAMSDIDAYLQVLETLLSEYPSYWYEIEDALDIKVIDINNLKVL